MKYCFLILNYLSYWETIKCIESIDNLFSQYNYQVVIVDNGSNNESFKILNDQYENRESIHVLSTGNNLGFANGNNFGFNWCKNNIDFDYLICCNNDIVFIQDSFLDIVDSKYRSKNFYILGPDIQKPLKRGVKHQNPHYPHLDNKEDIEQFKKALLSRKQRFQNDLIFRYKYFTKEFLIDIGIVRDARLEWMKESENSVLHGACIIFSPRYAKENEWLFYPGTFMYGEEQILYYLIKSKNESSLYSPDLRVMHMHGVATRLAKKNRVEREIFAIENRIKSIDVLLDLIEKDRKIK